MFCLSLSRYPGLTFFYQIMTLNFLFFLNPFSYKKLDIKKNKKGILDYTQHFCMNIPEAVSGDRQHPSYTDCYLPYCSEEFTYIRFQSKQKKLRKMALCRRVYQTKYMQRKILFRCKHQDHTCSTNAGHKFRLTKSQTNFMKYFQQNTSSKYFNFK